MVTMGAIFLVIFPFWEYSSRFARKRGIEGRLGSFLGSLAPYPLIPLRLLKSSTFSAGCLLAVFYFSKCAPTSVSHRMYCIFAYDDDQWPFTFPSSRIYIPT